MTVAERAEFCASVYRVPVFCCLLVGVSGRLVSPSLTSQRKDAQEQTPGWSGKVRKST